MKMEEENDCVRSMLFGKYEMGRLLGQGTFAKVARGKLREDAARKYFQQLISAVDYCHSRGVSHRDLKPENLLLDENEDLKVSDFGLSALPEQLRHDGLLHTQCGTPAYVAPEVLRKKGYDGAKADIWSCGVILFVLLAGFLPFQDENLMKMYRKVFKAEFQCPPWFSHEARRLVSKLLVADPAKRMSISSIMEVPWFKRGFTRTPSFSAAAFDDEDSIAAATATNNNAYDNKEEDRKASPAFFNAFELISSMSTGFDLSSLFECKRRAGSMFTSRYSAPAIMARLEGMAQGLRYSVVKVKDFKVRLQGEVEGRKGRLEVTAEVFEAAPEMAVVEFSKSAGDTLEYAKFCHQEVRPALKDIVWTWQGDSVCTDNAGE